MAHFARRGTRRCNSASLQGRISRRKSFRKKRFLRKRRFRGRRSRPRDKINRIFLPVIRPSEPRFKTFSRTQIGVVR